MTDWRYQFDANGLNYLSGKAKKINDIAGLLGVPPPGVAGGIAREMTLEQNDYRYLARRAVRPIKELLTSSEADDSGPNPMTNGSDFSWKPITHGTIADYFARANALPRGTLANPGYMDKLANPIFFDIGPGNIKIRTAINMLQNYNRMFPDSDPLDLKRYNDQYDLLVRDLKNPDSDTTIKIAGLVAREGQDFYRNVMTPQRWAALSDDQRAAALTKYYAVGKERLEDDFLKQGGSPGTYTPDFKGDGSDMYLYDPGNGQWSNPALLKNALSPGLRTENGPEIQSGARADAGLAASYGSDRPSVPVQSLAARGQPSSPMLPPQVVANANYLKANGYAITPRTMYVAHVIGPQRAVDLFRTGATGSPDVPSPDAAMGDQVRGWVRALRADELTPPAGGVGAVAPGTPAPDASAIGTTSQVPSFFFQ